MTSTDRINNGLLLIDSRFLLTESRPFVLHGR